MASWQERVRKFHADKGLSTSDTPDGRLLGFIDASLLREECLEAEDAINGARWFPWEDATLAELAKELADVIYVALGRACVAGIDMDEVFHAVADSNDTKPNDRDDNGKIVKGEAYVPPDILSIIRKQKQRRV